MIYQHRATVTTAAGSTNTLTLNVKSGLCEQLLIRAQTSLATVFRADLTDANNIIVKNYAYHEGEINDIHPGIPVAGTYTVNITNASVAETFYVLFAVDER